MKIVFLIIQYENEYKILSGKVKEMIKEQK